MPGPIRRQSSRALREALAEREVERDRLDAERAPVAFHPIAAEHYRRKIADFKAALAGLARPAGHGPSPRSRRGNRDHPARKYEPVDIEIRGKLAALLAADAKAPAAAESALSGPRHG